MNDHTSSKFKKRVASVAVASCLSFAPWFAEAASLGKITVLSGLGQPLRAELEVGATRDEVAGMTARLAPLAAFQQAGIDYASVLLDLRFSVEKRANGQSVVKVSSSKPVNEPFLDFLIELNWSSGRLLREYTFLLDPPEYAAKGASRPVSAAAARVVETVRGGAAPGAVGVRPAARAETRAGQEAGAGTHVVQSGETLRKIATATQYEGVSLEQMLVALYKGNPQAFSGNNINRLKAGAIVNIPEKTTVEAVPETEAKKIYVAQARDWNAYRQKLAAAAAAGAAGEEAATQAAGGKIVAKVEEKAAPAEQAKDQVKVSRAEAAAKAGAAASGAAAEEDRISRGKALQEAQERVALLEKNVNELQKLVELKSQKLAELQQQSAGKKEEAKPAAPAAAIEAPKAVEAPKLPEVAEAPKPVAESQPAEPPKPVEPAKAPEPKAEPAIQPLPPLLPESEPSLVDELLADPLPLAGGAGVLALLAGLFFYKRRRSEPGVALTTTAIPGPSSLGPNSVFKMTGGQSVDTGNTPPQTGDFSQTGPGTIDTDEVDPVAEADVYMAYGRDAQAEEILIEALQKDPHRTAIHAKLLEIYANRKSLKQFETLASELYAQTGGAGAEWEKVALMGARLDPDNPLYTGAAEVLAPATFDADATLIISPEAAKATLVMPGALSQLAEAPAEAGPAAELTFPQVAVEEEPVGLPEAAAALAPDLNLEAAAPLAAVDDSMSLDFDLGTPAEPEVPAPLEAAPLAGPEEPVVTADALDFDLGISLPQAPVSEEAVVRLDQGGPEVVDVEAVDFDLGRPLESLQEVSAAPDFSPEGTLVMPEAVQDLTDTLVGQELKVPQFEAEPPENLVDFDLELGAPAAETIVNPQALRESMEEPSLAATPESPVDMAQADTLEFDAHLSDTTVLGQPMPVPSFDIGAINLDLAAEPPAEPVFASPAVEPAETAQFAESAAAATAAAAVVEVESVPSEAPADSLRDEVSTKLDLAKAYEEMGDLEGARELLNEVIGEGPIDLVEQAREILARIGE